ncbi:hypothetical protein JCM8208_006003 [Rhodotorula glutinis]
MVAPHSPPLSAPDGTAAYLEAVQARQARFRPSRAALSPSATYSFEPAFSIPLAQVHTHAFAAPPCASHLYTGGSDGFVRRYALHSTLNGTPAAPNLTSKPGGHERPPGTDLRQPVLSGYWENEEPGDWADDLAPPPASSSLEPGQAHAHAQGKVRWGPKSAALGPQSAVYSLAVQRDELWGLSGTARGSINLWTVRHDEGQVRHVFRPDANANSTSSSPSGHLPKAAVSVLNLDSAETTFLSGAWDGRILNWDLDTGSSTRAFLGHAAQVSSLARRPTHAPVPLDVGRRGRASDGDVEMGEGEGGEEEDEPREDAPGRVRADEAAAAAADDDEAAGARGARAGTRSRRASTRAAAAAKKDEAAPPPSAADEDADADADADGEIDDSVLTNTSPHAALPSRVPDYAKPDRIPLVGSSDDLGGATSDDVFVSTGLDGTVLLWDRRVGEGRGVVRRWDGYEAPGGERGKKEGASGGRCTSACWSPSGSHLYVARRAPSIQVYDLRQSAPLSTLALPPSTGPVSAVAALPNGQHLVSASWDCVRLWDVERAMRAAAAGAGGGGDGGAMPKGATVVPAGHYGGTVSAMHIDPACRWMFTTSGNRGWDGTSTESLSISEIRVVESRQ